MIVTMRPGIVPKCTRHRSPMKLYEFGEPTGLMMKAYKCDEDGCTRSYNSSQGYFDIVNDRIVRPERDQQDYQVTFERRTAQQISNSDSVLDAVSLPLFVRASGATFEARFFFFAAFCRREESLSYSRETR